MRDVSHKATTLRIATARAELRMRPQTVALIREGKVPKGDPLPVSRVAAVQAAKNTPQLIPYCHPVPIDFVGVEFELGKDFVSSTCTVKAIYKTGVEMEALAGAMASALNLYDMLKMVDEDLEIASVRLLAKSGGKSDFLPVRSARAGILVVSDSVFAGKSEDLSGAVLKEGLEERGIEVSSLRVSPDDPERIAREIGALCDEERLDLVVATGGTGVGPRDLTPEAVRPLLDRELPGVAEAIRAYGQARNPYAMLSRSLAGVRGDAVIVCLPGSPSAVSDALAVLFPHVLHALRVMTGARHDAEEAKAQ